MYRKLGWLEMPEPFRPGDFANLAYVQRVSDNVERLLGASVLALLCVIAWTTFAIVLVVVRMTKHILRAIELALTDQRS